MRKMFLSLVAVAVTLVCHSQTPEEIVNAAYKSASESKFGDIAAYVLPDSISPLSESEKKMFNDFALQSAGQCTSFTVEDVTVNAEGTEATFTVKTEFSDGRSFTEKGTLRKTAAGRWRLMADHEATDITDLYSVSNRRKMTPELMRNLYYATVMTLAAREIPQYEVLAGNIYSGGVLTEENDDKAFQLYTSAAEKGYVRALYKLAETYYYGYGVDRDYDKAMDYVLKEAEKGDAVSMSLVGLLYITPEYSAYDPAKGREWLEKAYNSGEPNAARNLAVTYYNGSGVEQDYKKAVEYFYRALETKNYNSNDGEAERALGICYRDGLGVAADVNEAIKWFEKSAELGDVGGLSCLAELYYDSEQYDKWLECVDKLEAVGTSQSYYKLAILYYKDGPKQDLNKFYEYLLKSAQLGSDDGEAENNLAVCYKDGLGVTADVNEAMKWLEKSVELGNLDGLSNLADLYYASEQYDKLLECVDKLEAAGTSQSYYKLAILYYKDGPKQDLNKFYEYLLKSAQLGSDDGEAENNLAVCYKDGLGVTADVNEAMKWLEKSVELGNLDGLSNLADLYYASEQYDKLLECVDKLEAAGTSQGYYKLARLYYNDGPKQDLNKFFEYLLKSAQLGSDDGAAENNLGLCYVMGIGVGTDINEAKKWFEKSAELGNLDGLSNLTEFYYNSEEYDKWLECVDKLEAAGNTRAYFMKYFAFYNSLGVEGDKTKAMEYLMKSAESGDAQAMAQVANHYYNGEYFPKDFDKAIEWAEKSGNAGNSDAFKFLGLIYYDEGPRQDFTKVYEYFLKAAQLGSNDGESEYNLGICYKNGMGTEEDLNEAIKWFDKALQLGFTAGLERIGECYYMLENYEKALQIFNQLVENDNRYGEFMIGQCYENGHGVERDLNTAREWYEKGWLKKYGPAMDAYRRMLLGE